MRSTMDLYKKYKKSSSKQRSVNRGGLLTLVAVSSILLMVASGIRVTFEKMMVKTDITAMKAYVDNTKNLEKYEESKSISDETRLLIGFKENLDELNDIFVKKEAIGSNVMREIYAAKPSGVIITDLSLDGPLVTVSYRTNKEQDSSAFITGLKERTIVKEVNYNGYKYDTSTEKYTGSATLLLRGNF